MNAAETARHALAAYKPPTQDHNYRGTGGVTIRGDERTATVTVSTSSGPGALLGPALVGYRRHVDHLVDLLTAAGLHVDPVDPPTPYRTTVTITAKDPS